MLPPPPESALFPYTTLFRSAVADGLVAGRAEVDPALPLVVVGEQRRAIQNAVEHVDLVGELVEHDVADRKSTRLNSSHLVISYAVFCLKKKKKKSIIDEVES